MWSNIVSYLLTFVMVIVSVRLLVGATNPKFYDENYDFMDIYVRNDSYRGEKFPKKYLSVEGITPTVADLTKYEENLLTIVSYFAENPNDTDANVGVGLYFTKAVLKRTLLDYGDKIADIDKVYIENIIEKSEYYLSHFVYECLQTDDILRQCQFLRFDEPVVHSIRKFNKNTMKKWIMSDLRLHDHIEEMDDMTFGRFDYALLVTAMDDVFSVSDSDHCIASISSHAVPLKYDKMEACYWDVYCLERVLKMPSFAYILSHRFVYILGLYLSRRCYVVSEEVDKQHMDIMCANMYRETVYLARRGFFYRDLFMEHIALCGLLGYEEFHRHKWFKKILTWFDEDGCMMENRNFELNRTAIHISRAKTREAKRDIRRMKHKLMADECHHHQMALSTIVFAHAIRFTVHYL